MPTTQQDGVKYRREHYSGLMVLGIIGIRNVGTAAADTENFQELILRDCEVLGHRIPLESHKPR